MKATNRTIGVNPRILGHLGKDLITSVDVALVELVKNSIDAKAKSINIKLYSQPNRCANFPKKLFSQFLPTQFYELPMLCIEDDGCGMTADIVDTAFLEVGTVYKAGGSGMLGSKGIGRLASQRLGSFLVLETSSSSDNDLVFAFLDWSKLLNGDSNIPSLELQSQGAYTKLWIFGVQIEDYLENPIIAEGVSRCEMEETLYLRRDIESALLFLQSPFSGSRGKGDRAELFFWFDDFPVHLDCDLDLLRIAESVHRFDLRREDSGLVLHADVILRPWFAERIHRSLVGGSAFKRERQPHSFYGDLLEKNKARFLQALSRKMSESDLSSYIARYLTTDNSSPGKKENAKPYEMLVDERSHDIICQLLKVIPIEGEIYSFRQDAAIGRDICLDAVNESSREGCCFDDDGEGFRDIELKDVKRFLSSNNGIKLYRGIGRIGFLGNKESDWVQLQQYRTKGQQFYRFDAGNTVGYVSVFDPDQSYVEEISSRLDMSQNKVSAALKTFCIVVFNVVFYELTRAAIELVKLMLIEEGLGADSLSTEVENNRTAMSKLIEENKNLKNIINKMMHTIKKDLPSSSNSHVDVAVVREARLSLEENAVTIKSGLGKEAELHSKVGASLRRVEEQLELVRVDAYNNYKLMANGLITESIVHQLDSLAHSKLVSESMESHLDWLRELFLENKWGRQYNEHVYPISEGFKSIEKVFGDVAGLYSLLEGTFVHKDGGDVFEEVAIDDVVDRVWEGLARRNKADGIRLESRVGDLCWKVPKGTLTHVFYNLFDNSIYWIEWLNAQLGGDDCFEGVITVERGEEGTIIVSDNGPGVASHMNDLLFSPLESAKPVQIRRGMGLYVVKMLLNSFGANVILLPAENSRGNRYKFELKLESVDGRLLNGEEND